jgi:kinesin family protein C2/C3
MLRGGLWAKASSAFTDLKDNISTALENLDKAGEGEEEHNRELSREENELEAYKALLEEAQLQQVELSKKSSVVIAEKDAEIAHWKQLAQQQQGGDNGIVSPSAKVTDFLKLEKLKAENEMLESSVAQLEEQLKSLLKPANDIKALEKQLFNMSRKYEHCKNDLYALRAELEAKEKSKTETIDNLVLEYSKLAAESEQKQMQDLQMIKGLEKKKFVYETKIAAMEHSLSEFADRAVEASSSSSQSASIENVKLQSKIEQLTISLEAAKQELKDKEEEASKASVLSLTNNSSNKLLKNLLEEREAELKAALEHTADVEKDLQKSKDVAKQAVSVVAGMKAELEAAQSEIAQLKASNAAPVEATPVATLVDNSQVIALEKKLAEKQVEMDKLTATIKELQQSHANETNGLKSQLSSDNAANAASVAAGQAKYEAEIAELKGKVEQLSTSAGSEQASTANKITELEQKLATAHQNEHTLTSKVAELNAQIAATVVASQSGEAEAVKLISTQMQALVDSERQINDTIRQEKSLLESELAALKTSLTQLETQMATDKRSHEEALSHLAQKHESDMAEDATRSEGTLQAAVAAEQARHETLLAEEREKHQSELSQQRVQFEGLLAEEKAVGQRLVGEERDRHEALLKETIAVHDRLVAEQQQQHADIVTDLTKKHTAAIADLHAARAEALRAAVTTAVLEASAKHEAAMVEEQQRHAGLLVAETARHEGLLAQERAAHEQTMLSERESARSLLESTVQEARAEARKHQEDALATQRNELRAEKDAALAELKLVSEQDKAAALSALEAEKAASLEQLRTELTAEIARVTALVEEKAHELSIAQAKYVLKCVEIALFVFIIILFCLERFDEILKKALAELTVQKDKEQEAAIDAVKAECDAIVANFKAERDEFQALYSKENKLRKQIHNKLLEIQGNIRVVCRVRPGLLTNFSICLSCYYFCVYIGVCTVLEVERRAGEGVDVTEFPPSGEELVIQRDSQSKTRFEFDRVFAQLSEQEQVFESVAPLCISVLDGYNVCIFAYGQTGSGKTFTMEGYGDKIGVSPRAITHLFGVAAEKDDTWAYTFTFSMLEIYNESIRDLLDKNNKGSGDRDKLEVRQTPEGNVVPGLTEVAVTHPQQVSDLMKLGQTNRAVGAHDMNEHSSRSHSILTLTVRGRNKLDNSTSFGKKCVLIACFVLNECKLMPLFVLRQAAFDRLGGLRACGQDGCHR